jgi:hypothetical protein
VVVARGRLDDAPPDPPTQRIGDAIVVGSEPRGALHRERLSQAIGHGRVTVGRLDVGHRCQCDLDVLSTKARHGLHQPCSKRLTSVAPEVLGDLRCLAVGGGSAHTNEGEFVKHPFRGVVAVGAAAAVAALVIVPLASSTAVAASAKSTASHAFNKAVAAKYLLSEDKMRLAHGTLGRSEIKAIKGGPTGFESSNWSGYAESETSEGAQPDTFTKVSATWVEPTITCSTLESESTEYQIAAFWVGIDGFGSDTVEQDGTLEECYGDEYLGAADWWEMYPYNSVDIENSVAGGQKINASVTRTGTKYKLSVKVTHNADENFSTTQNAITDFGGPAENISAEWIAEAPCCNGDDVYDLAQWSPPIKFTKAKVTGSAGSGTISSYASGGVEDYIDMVGDISDTIIAEVPSSGVTNSFKDTWLGYH